MKIVISILIGIFACMSVSQAETMLTVERAALHQVVVGLKVYKAVNNGQEAKNWKEIATVVDMNRNNEGLKQQQGYTLENRYEFIKQQVPYLNQEGGTILMIRVTPLEGKVASVNGLYRYFIYKSKAGNISEGYASEEKIRAMFKASNAELPRFDNFSTAETEYLNGKSASTPPIIGNSESFTSSPSATMKPQSAATPAGFKAKAAISGFPIWAVAILGAVIVVAAAFFLRRK